MKKDSYLIWLEFFSLWFVNVLADVGAPKSVKIRRSDYFFVILFIYFSYDFLLAILTKSDSRILEKNNDEIGKFQSSYSVLKDGFGNPYGVLFFPYFEDVSFSENQRTVLNQRPTVHDVAASNDPKFLTRSTIGHKNFEPTVSSPQDLEDVKNGVYNVNENIEAKEGYISDFYKNR